jgi:hypothetical protein
MFLKKRYLGYMVLPFLFLGCGISENDEVKEMLDQNTTFVNHVDMSISEILVNGDIKHVTESKLIMEILSEIDHLDMASIENGKYFKRILSVSKYNAIHRMFGMTPMMLIGHFLQLDMEIYMNLDIVLKKESSVLKGLNNMLVPILILFIQFHNITSFMRMRCYPVRHCLLKRYIPY